MKNNKFKGNNMHKLKKFLSVCVVITMLMSIFAFSVAATDDMNISATAVAAKQGKTVDVTISLNGNTGIWGLRFNVAYNHEALTLTGTQVGTVFSENEITAPPSLNESEYVFMATRKEISNTISNGHLITLTFEVKEDAAPGEYPIALKLDDAITFESADVSVAMLGGSVTVDKVETSASTTGAETLPVGGAATESTTADNGKRPTTGDELAVIVIMMIASAITISALIAVKKAKK